MTEPLPHIDKNERLQFVMTCIESTRNLLVEAGYQPDSSVMVSLTIARSNLKDELSARSSTTPINAAKQAPVTVRPGPQAEQPVANSGSAEVNTPAAAPVSPHSATAPKTDELIAYLDALFVSGNDKPTTSTLFAYSSLQIIKEMLAEGLPLDYHIVESEAVYRRKKAAYGDATRATSPLDHLRARIATSDDRSA